MANRKQRRSNQKTKSEINADIKQGERFKQTLSILREKTDEELKECIEINTIRGYPKRINGIIELCDIRMSNTDKAALAYEQEFRKRNQLIDKAKEAIKQ